MIFSRGKMRSKIWTIILMILVSLSTISVGNTSGNPLPAPVSGTDIPDGGLVPDEGEINFKSERIVVWIDEDAEVSCQYEFYNPNDWTVNESIILPFHQNPEGVILKIDDQYLNYTRTNWSSDFRLEEPREYQAISFDLTLSGRESLNVTVEYRRPISRERYYDDLMLSFVYLARTGSLWNGSIENAIFEFYINSSIGPDEDSRWKSVDFVFYYDEKRKMDGEVLGEVVEFLHSPTLLGSGYFHLKMTKKFWVPMKDVGVLWKLYSPDARIDATGEIGSEGLKLTMNSSRSDDIDGEIISWNWSTGDHGVIKTRHIGNRIVTNTTINSTGFKMIRLIITDDQGLKGSVDHRFLVAKQGELFSLDPDEIGGTWNPNDDEWEYSWYLDGMKVGENGTLELIPLQPGEYTLTFELKEESLRGLDPNPSVRLYVLENPDYVPQEDDPVEQSNVEDDDEREVTSLILLTLISLFLIFMIVFIVKKSGSS